MHEWVIYELHVGTFTDEGTFEAVIPRLPYLRDFGVTAIELMPIAQFPGERNWGYDVVLPWAAQHSYGGPEGLRRLAEAIHEQAAELGRTAVLIAESDLNDPKLILPRELGGYGLDAQWADDFCHALEAQLVGEASNYTPDFGGFGDLVKALREAFVFTGRYSAMRQRRFGRSPYPARRDQFVVFLQNHDQVGNRPGGERLGHHIPFPQQKLAAATVLLSPFVPLLFMGEEYAEPNPFLYITHHGDADLVEAVRAGRQAEFAHFTGHDAAPNPQAGETFARSRLQPHLREAGEHQALHDFYRELLRLRRELPVLTDPDADRDVIARVAERVVLLHARGNEGETVAILNFADVEQHVSLPVPDGT